MHRPDDADFLMRRGSAANSASPAQRRILHERASQIRFSRELRRSVRAVEEQHRLAAIGQRLHEDLPVAVGIRDDALVAGRVLIDIPDRTPEQAERQEGKYCALHTIPFVPATVQADKAFARMGRLLSIR